jgi:hypothetical protein
MKVSVIAYCFPDYLMEILSDGLIRLLGRENVSFDANHATPQDSMRAPIYEKIRAPNAFGPYGGDVLVASTRSGTDRIRDWMGKTGRRRVAVIDGEDDSILRGDFMALASVYFKREIPLSSHLPAGNIRPLPFGAIPEEIPVVERSRAVTFLGKRTDQMREGVWQALGSREEFIGKDEYNKALASSVIGVSVRGAGWDTYRYWETAYFGCALLAQFPAIHVPGNFEDGREAVFWRSVSEFKSKLDLLLSDRKRALEIGQAGRAAVLERHLSTHRAKTVLEAVS